MANCNMDNFWVQECLYDPEKYKIYVDNDDIFVCEITEENPDGELRHSFSSYGYDFVVFLLEYLGANVDYV